jgi:hypothetical protein
VFTWRRQARTAERVGPCFAPVQIAASVETGEENSKPPSEGDRRMRELPTARNGLIEIDLGKRNITTEIDHSILLFAFSDRLTHRSLRGMPGEKSR